MAAAYQAGGWGALMLLFGLAMGLTALLIGRLAAALAGHAAGADGGGARRRLRRAGDAGAAAPAGAAAAGILDRRAAVGPRGQARAAALAGAGDGAVGQPAFELRRRLWPGRRTRPGSAAGKQALDPPRLHRLGRLPRPQPARHARNAPRRRRPHLPAEGVEHEDAAGDHRVAEPGFPQAFAPGAGAAGGSVRRLLARRAAGGAVRTAILLRGWCI